MPATTIDQVISALDNIILKSKEEESPMGYFAALYRKVTKQVKKKIDEGFFDDNPRMEQLDVIFANRYLEAYKNYKANFPITSSWEVAFKATELYRLIVLQHLLLGMNAHINLDLGIAAAEVCDETNIHDLKADFNRINDILAELLEEVENDLAEIWPTLLKILKFFKKVDDFLINFSMTLARDGAWKFANKLVNENDLVKKNQLLLERDAKIAKLGRSIRSPGIIEQIIFWIIRIMEKGSVPSKIEALEN